MSDQTLAIKVTPRADRDAVLGWSDESQNLLLLKVTAVPDAGKANVALVKTLASSLGVPKSAIRIVRGQTSRHKLLQIDIDPEKLDSWKQELPIA